MADEIIVQGKLIYEDYGECIDALWIEGEDEPLCSQLEDINGKNVTVSWYISDGPYTGQELLENSIQAMAGSMYARYSDRYSDYTGYLWTDEHLKVGDHDLMEDLTNHIGKYLYMKIVINSG